VAREEITDAQLDVGALRIAAASRWLICSGQFPRKSCRRHELDVGGRWRTTIDTSTPVPMFCETTSVFATPQSLRSVSLDSPHFVSLS